MTSFLASVSNLLDQADNFAEKKASQSEKLNSLLGKKVLPRTPTTKNVTKNNANSAARSIQTIAKSDDNPSVALVKLESDHQQKNPGAQIKTTSKTSRDYNSIKSSTPTPPESNQCGDFLGQNTFLQSEIRRLKDANAGLKDVWTKSREKLQRMKKVLENKESLHQKKIEQLVQQKQAEVETYRNLLAAQEKDTQLALEAKNEQMAEQSAKMDRLNKEENNREKEKELRRQEIKRVQDQRDEILKHQKLLTKTHKAQLEALREQLERRLDLHEQEKRNYDNRATEFASHAENLEDTQVEYTAALAKREHEFQQKELENKRLKDENRWIKADQQALKTENTSKQTTIELLEEKLRNIQSRLKVAVQNKVAIEHDLEILEEKTKDDIMAFQQQLQTSETLRLSDSADTQLTDTLKTQLEQQSSELISLRSLYDNIWSEKTEISVLHEQAKTQVAALSDQIRKLQKDNENVEIQSRRSSMRRSRSSPKVFTYIENKYGKGLSETLQAVDTIGQFLGRNLFASRAIRMGFVIYLACFHLFLFSYLYIHTHEGLNDVSSSSSMVSSSVKELPAETITSQSDVEDFVESTYEKIEIDLP